MNKQNYDTETAIADIVPKPNFGGRFTSIGGYALTVSLILFFAWIAFAPLDEGVPGQGLVVIDTRSKVVQHLSGGVVSSVSVKEGQVVKAGDILISLDKTASNATFQTSRLKYIGLRTMQGRLMAEQSGASLITWHKDVLSEKDDSQVQDIMSTQSRLFEARKSSLSAELHSIDEYIAGQEGMLVAYKSMLNDRKKQQKLYVEELNNTKELSDEGYIPKNKYLELQRMVADSGATVSELIGNIVRTQKSISEYRQRSLGKNQEYRKEVDSQLAEIEREVDADKEKSESTKVDVSRMEIRSPDDGQVIGLTVQSIGAVVLPGQKLMEIVPKNQVLILEVKVNPSLIDKVTHGLSVDVRFSAFANTPQLVVNGSVESISADLLSDPKTDNGYYLARVKVTQEGISKLGSRKMQAGMPVEVVFKTGERTMLNYLLHPLTKRIAAALKEE